MLRPLTVRMWRSPVKWAAPLLIPFFLWFVGDFTTDGLAIWSEVAPAFLFSTVVVWSIAGGLAGLRAWREKRASLQELVGMAPRDPINRHLVAACADVGWLCLYYVIAFVVVAARVAPSATWGGPDLGMLVAGLAAIWAGGLLGWMAGWLLPTRITGPVAGLVLFVVGQLAQLSEFPFSALLPTSGPLGLAPSEMVRPGLGWWQTLWFVALALIALSSAALTDRSRRAKWVLAAAILLAVVSASILRSGVGREPDVDAPMVCSSGVVEVCYHPALASGTDWISEAVESTLLPLAQADAGPSRVTVMTTQTPPRPWEDRTQIYVRVRGGPDWLSLNTADTALPRQTCSLSPSGDDDHSRSRAQSTARIWLVHQAGYNPGLMVTVGTAEGSRPGTIDDVTDPEMREAIARLEAMDDGARSEWLNEHFYDLWDCQLPFEDLP